MAGPQIRPRRIRRDELENQLNRGALWAVTYGDLMSYLMIFFLVLFAFSLGKTQPAAQGVKYEESLTNIQRVFGGPVDERRVERARRRQAEEATAKRIEESVAAQNLANFVEVEATDESVKLTLKEAVLFDSGKADLKPESLVVLQGIAAEVKALSNDVLVEGHTDNVPVRGGKYDSNWELSMSRAYAVIRFFLSQGVDAKHLAGVGHGEYRPVADNSTPEGRAQNRRIGINLIRTK